MCSFLITIPFIQNTLSHTWLKDRRENRFIINDHTHFWYYWENLCLLCEAHFHQGIPRHSPLFEYVSTQEWSWLPPWCWANWNSSSMFNPQPVDSHAPLTSHWERKNSHSWSIKLDPHLVNGHGTKISEIIMIFNPDWGVNMKKWIESNCYK